MTILCDHEIVDLVNRGHVYVKHGPTIDFDIQIGPSSLDLRLDTQFKILNRRKVRIIDTKNLEEYSSNIVVEEHTKDDGIIIHPGEFVLGTTLEYVKVPPDMAVRVEGRSSYGRIGLIIHATAGFIDPGFIGQITLEIQNIGSTPIRIYPEDRICQIVFHKMNAVPEKPYGSKQDNKYYDQDGVVESRLDREHRS